MRFSTLVSTLIVASDAAFAAQHSGRSLKHVGKEDKISPLARREPHPKEQQKRAYSEYLTNSTTSEYLQEKLQTQSL
jgi:carboxypeptidase D